MRFFVPAIFLWGAGLTVTAAAQTVQPAAITARIAPSSISLFASPNPATYGQAVTITATVTVGATGKVTFYDGAAILGVGAVSSGSASISTILLQSGVRSLRAHYSGDGTYAASTSSAYSETVTAGTSLGLRPAVSYPAANNLTSLVVGDFNGDHKADLAFCFVNGGIGILIGNGDGTFRPVVAYAPGIYPSSMTTGDFNGDGTPDLAVSNGNTGQILILFGNGDGTFQAAVNAGSVTGAGALAVGDFNGDGKADLAVTVSSGSLFILLGNGDGTFQPPVQYHTNTNSGGSLATLAIGDLNRDGFADVVVAGGTVVSVLLGAGDGTFGTAKSFAVPTPYSVALGDLNGDGVLDVVTGDAVYSGAGVANGALHVLLGNGDGTLQPAVSYGAFFYPQAVALADMNGDGKLDAVVAALSGGPLFVMAGNGDGTFQSAVGFADSATGIALAVGDFNGDGKADIATGNYNFSSAGVVNVLLGGAVPDLTVSLSHGSGFTQNQTGALYSAVVSNIGTFASSGAVGLVFSLPSGFTATSITGAEWSCTLATATCTRLDMLAPGSAYPAITLQVTVGNLTGSVTAHATVSGGNDGNPANNTATDTANVRASTTISLNSSPNPATLGQQVTLVASVGNGSGTVTFYDGSAILGTAAVAAGQAVLQTNLLPSGSRSLTAHYNGDSSNGPATSSTRIQVVNALTANGVQIGQSYKISPYPSGIVVADVNRDGKLDILTSNRGDISLLLGNGDGTFQPVRSLAPQTASSTIGLAVADFNGDGKPDLAYFTNSNTVTLALGNGDGTFQTPTNIGTPTLGLVAGELVTADLNRDGFADLLVMGTTGVTVYLGNGDGSFQPPLSISLASYTPSTSAFFALLDMNGDGVPDIVMSNSGANAPVSVYLAVGDGTFQMTPLVHGTNSTYTAALTAGDFSSNGRPDVEAINGTQVNTLLGNGDGSLQAGPSSTLYPYAGLAVPGDFNGDGKLDFAYLNTITGGVALALGNGSGGFQSGIAFSTDSGIAAIALADFNGDGLPDFVTANTAGTLNVFLGAQVSGLQVASSHSGRFTAGATGSYQITVTNSAYASTSGMVSVTDTLPSGLTATAISGNGWTCTLATLTCTRSDALGAGSSYAAISVNVNVSAALPPSSVTNGASVTYGGVTNSFNDATAIVIPSSTTLNLTPGAATLGQAVTMTAVTNGSSGSVTFLDGANFLGSAVLSGGTATLSTRLLPSGTNSIRATYSGDATHAPSVSPAKAITVTAKAASGFSAAATYGVGSGPVSIAAGDFNGDGKTDLVTANSTANTVSVLLGRGDGTFQPKVDYNVGAGPVFVAVGDFNGDGYQDLAVANQSDMTLSILLGRGDGTFQPATTVSTIPNAPNSLVVADFNQDGNLDLFVTSYTYSGGGYVYLGNGNGTFSRIGSSLNYAVDAAVAGDFNRDGKVDLVISYGQSFYVELGNGDGTFTTANSFGGGTSLGMVAADLNGDGFLDIITLSGIYLGNGDGTFRTGPVFNGAEMYPAAIATADVNGDGLTDVLTVGGPPGTLTVNLGRSDGTLSPPSNYPTGLGPQAIVVGDFNGDGGTDIAIANMTDGNVTVYLGSVTVVLNVSSVHTGNFTFGGTGVYTLQVSNLGPGVTSGTVTLSDSLPAGLTAVSMSGSGWSCTVATATCTRADPLGVGANYPAVTLTVNVANGTSSPALNLVTVSGGGAVTAIGADSTIVNGGPPSPLLTAPANQAQAVSTTPLLQWAASAGATSYDVYLGTSPTPALVTNVTGTSYTPATLQLDTTYYWQIAAKNGAGSNPSAIWSFNTTTLLANMISPAPGTQFSGPSVTFTWTSAPNATAYWLDVGTFQGQGNISGGLLANTVTSKTVSSIPTNAAPIYVRLWTQFNGSTWLYNDYSYTASSGQTLATMSSPAPGSTLPGVSAVFTWNAGAGATAYWLDVGSIQGQGNISAGQLASTVTSETVSGIPTTGGIIYVRLWTQFNGSTWLFNDYTYTASSPQTLATMTSPAPGSTLSSSATFTWSAGTGATAYWLDVGTIQGQGNISAGQVASTVFSRTVSGIPTNGGAIYVRLWTQFGGSSWLHNDYVYLAASSAQTLATMSSPAPGSTLTATTTFTWNPGGGATAYWLDVGTVQGSGNISAGQLASTVTSKTVSGIPSMGAIYVRLWTQFNGSTWQYIDYAYSSTVTQSLAVISSPTPGAVLPGSTVTFSWTVGAGATAYWLDVGTVQGTGNLSAGQLANTVFSKTVSGLPTNGSTLYVRLWTQFNGSTWQYYDYVYLAANPTVATMSSPTPGSTLAGASVTFTWNAGNTATAYWLDVGTVQGQGNISAGQLGNTVTGKTVSGIPTNGAPIYVRLWTQFNGSTWQFIDYTYTAF